MKRVICIFVAAVLVVGLIVGCAAPTPAPAPAPAPTPTPTPTPTTMPKSEPIVLKAVAWLPLGRSLTAPAEQVYIPMIEERSNGELVIDLIGGPEVIAKTEQGDAAAKGAIDLVFGISREYAHIVPAMHGSGSIGGSAWDQREQGIFDYWVEKHMEANLMYLGKYSGGEEYFFIMYLKKPITSIGDFLGLRIDGMDMYDTFIQELGGIPMSVGGAGVFTALERGLMDGFVWSNAGTFPGWEEIAKAPIAESLGPCHTFHLVMNLDKWNSLPKHLQDLLIEVTAEFEHIVADYYNEMVIKTREQWEAAGAEYIKLSPNEGEWYREEASRQRWSFAAKLMGPELTAEMKDNVLSK